MIALDNGYRILVRSEGQGGALLVRPDGAWREFPRGKWQQPKGEA